MARKRKKTGICCICGRNGPLSFEHVPPQKAFNTQTVIAYQWEDHSVQKSSKAKPIQGGIGAHTLCAQCNSDTGSWYGGEYVKWSRNCHQIATSWRRFMITDSTVTLRDVYPSRFLKQVVTCFFSTLTGQGTDALARNYPELKSFVLDRNSKQLPAGFRFFMNLYLPPPGQTIFRQMPIIGKLATEITPLGFVKRTPQFFFEIAHPPFQLVMTKNDQDCPGATEITHFKDFDVDQMVDIQLHLKVITSPKELPGSS